MPVENPGYDDGTLTITGVSISDRVGSGFIVHTNRPPTLQEIEDFANSIAMQPDRLTAENARLRKVLTSIRDIGLGPDRGSGQWQADCARSLARAALEATDAESR